MSRDVVLLDAGVGNLGNVARALRHVGGAPRPTSDPDVVRRARCLVLPGVGAFRPPRERLRGALEDALRAALAEGAWLLGICVGYQLLFDTGEEFGATDGLGLLPGRVRELPGDVPLPHIGWNRLAVARPHPLVADLGSESWMYFVHSFAPEDVPADVVVATTTHGRTFPAIAARGRVAGVQFHPERSGEAGLRLLARFLDVAGGDREAAA